MTAANKSQPTKMVKPYNTKCECYLNFWVLLCLSGQEMAPTGQRPLLKDSWRQNSILGEEQLADPTIAYITTQTNIY